MDMKEVVEEVCVVVNYRARAKNIRIVRGLVQEIPYFGDEALVHQLFLIFLDNAIKYSPGGTSIRVTLGNRHGEIRASFADEGVGISSEHLPFIFARFYRAAPASTREPHSLPLGLALPHTTLRAH